MALPSVLKNFMVFLDGKKFAGECVEFKPSKLARKMEKFRGAGMVGEVDIDMGQEPLEVEFTMGAYVAALYRQYGNQKANGVQLRFAGAFTDDSAAKVKAVEIVAHGRFQEIEPGTAKAGDKAEEKFKMPCTYYKVSIEGKPMIEIDMVNFIFVVDGVDLLADERTALGL